MTLVLSIQPYYAVESCDIATVSLASVITIDCEDPGQPMIFLPLIEKHLKRCLSDGLLTTGMSVSVCLWREQCNEGMVDVSEIVCWFSTHVANLHDAESAWW